MDQTVQACFLWHRRHHLALQLLHSGDTSRNGFEELKDPRTRAFLIAELNQLTESLECQVVACAIK